MRHWTAPFVLAMLLLRALVPAGFMLAPVDGHLAVVLCDADGTAALHSGHDMSGHDMPGHDMPGHEHPGGHTHPDPTCPYAQSAGATPIPFLPAAALLIAPAAAQFPELLAQTHTPFGPARQQSPRGPPRLA